MIRRNTPQSRPKATLSASVDSRYLESMHQRWLEQPNDVPETWRFFFEGMAFAEDSRPLKTAAPVLELTKGAELGTETLIAQAGVASLTFAYRSRGHILASVDPLGDNEQLAVDYFDLRNFGLNEKHLEQKFVAPHFGGAEGRVATLAEIIAALRKTYCRSIGVEYMHIQDRNVRRWLQQRMEPNGNEPSFPRERKIRFLEHLNDAALFESFTHSRYPGQKRFSLEGGESLIPTLKALLDLSSTLKIEEVVMGMAHRGRLNVLANIMGMSYATIFSEFEGDVIPDSVHGDGDVKYHKGFSSIITTADGHHMAISLAANPSHLEAVNPVVLGRVRAKQRIRNDTEQRKRVLPVLMHGDAAFAGQGIVAETLNLSQLLGYRTGGTIHLIINNQIGFTTLPEEGRSSAYCTDVAKMLQAPIFHVNGDDVEACVHIVELALQFRQEYARDVVVDIIGYRRHGHNEADEPRFTQPVLYKKIKDRPSIHELYREKLVQAKELTQEDADRIASDLKPRMEQALAEAKSKRTLATRPLSEEQWRSFSAPFSWTPVPTASSYEQLRSVARALCTVPPGFVLNPKLVRQLEQRLQIIEKKGTDIEWSFAELLAFGTLLQEGLPVRLSGQDSARGTFSQRHAVWQHMETDEPYVPLNHIGEGQARLCVYNSSLSENAVLGFEYGYSLSEPRMLILWEAQFGDFCNGAQVIIDQFICGAESKWQHQSGIVLLLPHGYEGQGPEHSNAYLERFLAAGAELNVTVCNLTTPAQHFHLLRRQVKRDFRRPLIVLSPKSMLRHKRAVSSVDDLLQGGFNEVLDDPTPPKAPRRLLFCAGKVFYDLLERREQDRVEDVAIVRLEQLYPLHWELLEKIVAKYRDVKEIIWVQEEPQNRGAWTYIYPKLGELFPKLPVAYVGREASASPATGSLKRHEAEQTELVREAIHGRLDQELKDDENRRESTDRRRINYRRPVDRVV